ncbi:MAG TPA: AcvB/VirJ family lysyl-phosphatidylglycerol hydrolase [Patescibacteria group bacterium]|nr:AcvB/VirJ family lysyl-phosphatidylglycerol hydrolase [Patescibacteria group bacterium]
MRRAALCVLLAASCLCGGSGSGAMAATATAAGDAAGGPGYVVEQVSIPLFGMVKVYRPEPIQATRGVVLFVSGDGGWNLGVVEMARRSASRAIVVGLSMPAWQKVAQKDPAHCWFPAGDLESTAQAIEKIYRLPQYIRPILVGYSSGATVVYGALAQAPAETFTGGVSLGFCPDMELARPFCSRGDWKPTYDAKKKTSLLPPRAGLSPRPDGSPRWIALQGMVDQVCDPKQVGRFVSGIPAARMVPLPRVGHGFSVARNWGAAFDSAIEGLLAPATVLEPAPGGTRRSESHLPNHSPEEIRDRLDALDLPLEIQWLDGARSVLIFLSGDGGWAELDQSVTSALAAQGVGVVGWNTLRYFWQPKTPDEFRADLARVVAALPEGMRVYAGGFSFGAEVVPVSLSPGSGDALSRIAGLVLLGPGPYATFEVSPLDWIRTGESPTDHPVAAALERLDGLPVLCLDAAQHGPSGCPSATIRGLTHVNMPGGHHFGGDYDALAARILDFMRH